MLRSLSRIAVSLDLDTIANRWIERLYTSTTAPGRLSSRFQILVYHKVSPDRHPTYAPVDPQTFEQQMSFLSRCYNVMDLTELVELSAKGAVPERAVAITFDDGYSDNYTYAFPILKKYGLKATIFLATDVIGTSNLLWHDRVFDAFRFSTRDRAELHLDATLEKAKSLWGEARTRYVEEVETALRPQVPAETPRMLNWDQVREMHRSGIAFGSHTVTHPILSCLPQEELRKELMESRRQIVEQLNAPVVAFAYPNGRTADFTEEAKTVLQECGYKYAVTTVRGFNLSSADPFELKRDLPWHPEIELFRFKFFLQRHGLYN